MMHLASSRPSPTTSTRATTLGLAACAALAFAQLACIESVRLPTKNVRPDPSRPSHVEQETGGSGAVQAAMRPTDDSIEIQAAYPTYCRSVKVTPNVGDQTTERTLTAGGWVGQLALAGGAATFGVAGGHLLANPCSPAEAAELPCIDQARSAGKALGIASVTVAGIVGTVMLANALATIDTTSTVEAPPTRTPGSWKVCNWTAASYARVEVWFPNGFGVGGSTDIRGRARLDLATVPPSPVFATSTHARVRVGGQDVGAVNFRNTQLYMRSLDARPAAGRVASAGLP